MTRLTVPLLALSLALPTLAQAAPPDITRVKLRATSNPDVHRLVLVMEPGVNDSDWSTFQAAFSVTSADGAPVGQLSAPSGLKTMNNGKYRVTATLQGAPATLTAATVDVQASHLGGTAEQSLVLPLHGDVLDGMFTSQIRTNNNGASRLVTRSITDDEPAAFLATTLFGADGAVIHESVQGPTSVQRSFCADLIFPSDPTGLPFHTSSSLKGWDGQVLDVIERSDTAPDASGDAVWQTPTALGGDARMRFIPTGGKGAVVCLDLLGGGVDAVESVKLAFIAEGFGGGVPTQNPLILTESAQLLRFVDPLTVDVSGAAYIEQALLGEDGKELDSWSFTGGADAGIQRRAHPIGPRLGISKGWASGTL